MLSTEALDSEWNGIPYDEVQEFLDVELVSAYYELLKAYWSRREGFITVEHDIEASQAALDDLQDCDHYWCGQPYEYLWPGNLHYGLGCMKFSRELLRREPDIFEEVGNMSNSKHERKHWCSLDAFLQDCLHRRGYHMCQHSGRVKHIDIGNSHGCWIDERM